MPEGMCLGDYLATDVRQRGGEMVTDDAATEGMKDRLQRAILAGGLCVYEWDVSAERFTVDDYGGLFSPGASVLKLARQTWESMLHADDRERIMAAFHLHFEKKSRVFEAEYRIRVCTGRYQWILDRSQVTKWSEDGEPKTLSGILVGSWDSRSSYAADDRPRSEAIAALQRSEGEKLAILQALHGLVAVRYLDPNLHIIWDNVGGEDQLRMPGASSAKDYCYSTIHGRQEPCVSVCTPREALAAGYMMKREARLDDGRAFVEISNPVKGESGEVRGVVFVAVNVTRQKQVEEDYGEIYKIFHSFLENSPTPITVFSESGHIKMVNAAWEERVGLNREEVCGKHYRDIFQAELANQIGSRNQEMLTAGAPVEHEEAVDYPSGHYHFHTVRFPIRDTIRGDTSIGAISVDVTARKDAEKILEERESELILKSKDLEEANAALRVLLTQRADEQVRIAETVVVNVKQLVLPYIAKLKEVRMTESQLTWLRLAETHLNDVIAPFLRHVTLNYPNTTAKEIQVATLVRDGMTNKDIADIMNISVSTVQVHRQNLRRKFGLRNNKKNLRTYLLSLDGRHIND